MRLLWGLQGEIDIDTGVGNPGTGEVWSWFTAYYDAETSILRVFADRALIYDQVVAPEIAVDDRAWVLGVQSTSASAKTFRVQHFVMAVSKYPQLTVEGVGL
jgi:hypothetical protein